MQQCRNPKTSHEDSESVFQATTGIAETDSLIPESASRANVCPTDLNEGAPLGN